MKRVLKRILAILALLIVLAGAAVLVLRFGFGIDVFDRGGWHETKEGGVQFRAYDGTPLSGWQTIGDGTYYFDPAEDCTMATGWLELEGDRWYLGTSGRVVSGWTELNGNRYFFGEKGIMTTGWLEDGGKRYRMGEDGVMQTGWLELDGDRYYLGADGAMQTGWLEMDEGFYWLDEDGRVITGLVTLDTGVYYLKADGTAHTGWLEFDGQRSYFGSDRAMVTGWQTLDGETWYFDGEGAMQTGWLELEGKRWYLGDSGEMHTGWLDTEDGLYWFREDGVMAVGRVTVDGVDRYFTSEGKYVVLVNRWNPVPGDYETKLVDFRGFKVSAEARDAMEQMIRDCNAAGIYCGVNSVYRSYDYQNQIWSEQVERYVARGYSREWAIDTTNKSIAVPGTSEHQLGLAIDLACGDDGYAWLAEHGWEYGFIMRYPYGDTEWTGILYEPWHYRYVGVELAKELYDLGLCMEEYMDMLTRRAGYEPAEDAE